MLTRLVQRSVVVVPFGLRRFIRHVPLVAASHRWLLNVVSGDSEFVHTIDAGPARGLRYPIRLPQDKGIWSGTYEEAFTRAIAGAVARGDVCLDIGGWHGFFSGVMALAGASHVYVFEPFPDNAARITRLTTLNPTLPITLLEAAVCADNGPVDFVAMPESSMGKLAASPFQAEARRGSHLSVQGHRLDTLVERGRIPSPRVVKIDVEGAELMVLQGAAHLLKTVGPELFIEVHSPTIARDCARLLIELGYSISVVETGAPPDQRTDPEICHFHAAKGRATA